MPTTIDISSKNPENLVSVSSPHLIQDRNGYSLYESRGLLFFETVKVYITLKNGRVIPLEKDVDFKPYGKANLSYYEKNQHLYSGIIIRNSDLIRGKLKIDYQILGGELEILGLGKYFKQNGSDRPCYINNKINGYFEFNDLVDVNTQYELSSKNLSKKGTVFYTTSNAVQLVKFRALLAILGQSNELGSGMKYYQSLGLTTDPDAYKPCWFRSIHGIKDPIAPAVRSRASMWPIVSANLEENGISTKVVNGAIGSLSFVSQVCGQVKAWSAKNSYNQNRSAELNGDKGDKGDLIIVGSRLWRCTTGNKRYAFFNDPESAGLFLYSPGSNVGSLIKTLDYIQLDRAQNNLLVTSENRPPELSTATEIGTTVSDGGISWTLVSTNATAAFTSFEPFKMDNAEFDPLGVLARLKENCDNVTDVEKKILVFSNGQSDTQGAVSVQNTILGWYRKALENISDWGVSNGFITFIGLTCANPNAEVQGLGFRMKTLDSAWESACENKVNGINVFRGSNLYRNLGKNPPVYPQVGLAAGTHLTDEGLLLGAECWSKCLLESGIFK